MIASSAVKKARKAAQHARIKKKETDLENYPAFYANQPIQLLRAAANEKIREAKATAAKALETVQLAEISGKGLMESQQELTVATLVVEQLIAAKRHKTGAKLVAAGVTT